MRALGIDFGERRVGLAVSCSEGVHAVPLRTVGRRSDAQLIEEIVAIAEEQDVGLLVIGLPLDQNGAAHEAAARVRSFARKLRRATPIEIHWVEETLTSHEALARLRAAGIDPRKHPERVDAVAAQIILQEGLDSRCSLPGSGSCSV